MPFASTKTSTSHERFCTRSTSALIWLCIIKVEGRISASQPDRHQTEYEYLFCAENTTSHKYFIMHQKCILPSSKGSYLYGMGPNFLASRIINKICNCERFMDKMRVAHMNSPIYNLHASHIVLMCERSSKPQWLTAPAPDFVTRIENRTRYTADNRNSTIDMECDSSYACFWLLFKFVVRKTARFLQKLHIAWWITLCCLSVIN